MPYAERDEGGQIVGLYAREQLAVETEFLEPDDPEVIAFEEKMAAMLQGAQPK